ncbi:MAG TPA: hypothetical protein VFW51_05135 [Actinomycetota bacterium]|nr:hypothetical protein [Actinomycetota bacterium]
MWPLSAHNVGSTRVLKKCRFVLVDQVEMAGESVSEMLFRLEGS